MPIRVDTSSTTQMAQVLGKHWRSCGTSKTKLVRTPTRGSSIGTWMGKMPNWECMFVHRKQGLFLSVYVDDIRMTGKKQNMAPMWKQLMKNEDLDEPASFLDHVCLGCTQRECKPNEKIIEQYTKMCGSRISAGATEKVPGWEKSHAKTAAWSYEMEGFARKCVARYCELANKEVEHFTKFQVLAWMIINSNRKNLNQLENCHKRAHISS